MVSALLLFTTAFIAPPENENLYKLEVAPFDFQNPDAGFEKYYIEGIGQIEASGQKLILRSVGEPHVIVVDTASRDVQVVGRSGHGPGEISHGVCAMVVSGDHIRLIPVGHLDRLIHFVGGKFADTRVIEAYPPIYPTSSSNSLATNGVDVVVPASPSTGYLAMVFKADGTQRGIGEPVFFQKEDRELITKVPTINYTSWVFADEHWYAAFAHLPQILKFDKSFNLVNNFTLVNPRINDAYNKVLDPGFPEKPHTPIPRLVEDIKFFRGKLYLMGQGLLFQLNPENGAILSVAMFSGSGETIGRPEVSTQPMAFRQFAFTDDGTLFLNHVSGPDLWNHDLFVVKNPPFLK